MRGPRKRIWKRIAITVDDSSDEEPTPCKVGKTQDVQNSPIPVITIDSDTESKSAHCKVDKTQDVQNSLIPVITIDSDTESKSAPCKVGKTQDVQNSPIPVITIDSDTESKSAPCKIGKTQDVLQGVQNASIITISDSDLSDDETPPCKVGESQYTIQDVQNAPEKTTSKQEGTLESRYKLGYYHQVLKKRRLDCSVPFIILNNISALCQHAICKVFSQCPHEDVYGVLLDLSKLSSLAGKLTVHCSKSEGHSMHLLMKLRHILEEIRKMTNSLVNSHFVLWMNGVAVWASFMILIFLVGLDPYTDLFMAAVQTLLHYFHSQVKALHYAFKELDKILNARDQVKCGFEAVYWCIINVAFLLNSLLIKKNVKMQDFVLITMEIAMLPSFGNDKGKAHCSLNLFRSVLKSQSVCWSVCTLKIYLEMCHPSFWNKNLLLHLESGSRVHKCTLLLLTLIQSSVELPENWRDISQSLGSKEEYILGRPSEDKLKDHSCQQSSETLPGSVLGNVNLIISYFYDLVMTSFLKKSNECLTHFKRFLDDLLILMEEFEWPAAEYVLILMCDFMVTSLKEDELPIRFRRFLLECVSAILLRFVHLMSSLEIGDLHNSSSKAKDPGSLTFLQGALLAYLLRNYRENGVSGDGCLFYLAVWQKDESAEIWKNKAQFFNEASWEERKFVNHDNVQRVVNRITGLRRVSDIKTMFNEVVLLNTGNDRSLSRRITKLVVHILEAKSSIFVEESLLIGIMSRSKEYPIEMRRNLVRGVTAYLLHRPDKLGSYYRILRSYISDKEVRIIRNTALEGMKIIGLKFYNDPKILRKLLLLLKTDKDYYDSAAQYFCNITWLKPVKDTDEKDLLEKRVSMLIDMFELVTDSNHFEEIFPFLFRLDIGNGRTAQLTACKQIVDALLKRCLEKKPIQNSKMVASFKLLNLFAKLTPGPLVFRRTCLFMHLVRQCRTIIPNVELTIATTEALDKALCCIGTDRQSFLFNVFIESFKISTIYNLKTIASGLNSVCLIAGLQGNYHTLEVYTDVCFAYMSHLLELVYDDAPNNNCLAQRQLCILNVILKNSEDISISYKSLEDTIKGIYALLSLHDLINERVIQTALATIGIACLSFPSLILTKIVKAVYMEGLELDVPTFVSLQVLRNICELLRSLLLEDTALSTHHGSDGSLTYPDTNFQSIKSGRVPEKRLATSVLNTYFNAASGLYVHPDKLVRLEVFKFLLVAGQCGSISCEQVMPTFVALAFDPEKCISDRALNLITKHGEYHSRCVSGSLKSALSMICCLNATVTDISSPIQGYCIEEDGIVAKMSVLSSTTGKPKSDCFGIIPLLLEKLDRPGGVCIFGLLFCAGNLAHFSYSKRLDVVSTISKIKEMVSSTADKIEDFAKVLQTQTTKLDVHKKRVGNALRLLLLLEIRSFLMEKYLIQKVEISKFELKQSYRVLIKYKETTFSVSDRSYGNRFPKDVLRMKFCPTICSEVAIRWNKDCCGRNFSKKSLERLYKQLTKLWAELNED